MLTNPVCVCMWVLLFFPLLVCGPQFDEMQVSRFLVSLEASGTPFEVVLNKADLVSEEEVAQRVSLLKSWGYEPLVVSCSGSGQGVETVMQAAAGRTVVLAGPSGVGKSSLINAIRLGRHRADEDEMEGEEEEEEEEEDRRRAARAQRGRRQGQREAAGMDANDTGSPSSESRVQSSRQQQQVQTQVQPKAGADTLGFLEVGDLTRYGRGMHTTTAVRLIPLVGGGKLADTPGFSQPSLERVSSAVSLSLSAAAGM